MRVMYWGRCWMQESMTGGWVCAKVRPKVYWWLRSVWLFLRIVWRPWHTERLDVRTAWEVCRIVGPGLSQAPIHRVKGGQLGKDSR